MLNWLRRLFGFNPLILELEQRPQVALDGELRESVRALAWHPGFQYLRNRLRIQRATLEAQLRGARHESLQAVEFLQSGIFWSAWLEDQIERQIAVPRRAPGEATSEEQALINAVNASIERVGGE